MGDYFLDTQYMPDYRTDIPKYNLSVIYKTRLYIFSILIFRKVTFFEKISQEFFLSTITNQIMFLFSDYLRMFDNR